MSIHKLRKKKVTPNVVRDFRLSFKAETADKILDLFQEYGVIGLDFWVRNRGASSLDVIIDGAVGVPVAINEAHGENNCMFGSIKIDVGAGAEVFDLVVMGKLCL